MTGSGFPGTPQAAIDPIGFIVLLIIVVNVVSTFLKRARAQQTKQANAQASPTQLQEAMRKSSADLAAARTAQRAKLQQAIRAARQTQAATVPTRAAEPAVVIQQTPPPAASDWQLAPMGAPDLPQPTVLPSFELEAQLPPGLTLVVKPQPSALAPATKLPILGGRFTGADLFVATAVIGPCAALRTIGHTPAAW